MADGRAVSLGWTYMETVLPENGGGFKMPANPRFNQVCHNGTITLNASRVTSESNKICGSLSTSRGRIAPTELGVRPAGGWGFELDANQLAFGLAEAVYANETFRQLEQKSNREGAAQVVSVAGGTPAVPEERDTNGNITQAAVAAVPGTITFSAAHGFVVGNAVRLTGFAGSGNGVFRVLAVTATTIDVLVFVDEATAGPGAFVKLAGISVDGTIDRSARTLTGVTNASALVGPYESLDIDGIGLCEVQSVSGTTVTFSKIPATFTDQNFDGYVYFGDTFRDAGVRRPIAVEQRFVDNDGGEWYVYFLGLYVSTYQHSGTNTETAQNITGSIEFVGIDAPELRSYARWEGAVTIPFMESRTFQTGSNVSAVRFNGQQLSRGNEVTSHNLAINNNPRVRGAYGTDGGIGVAFGDFTSAISVGAYLDTPDRYEPLVNGGQIDFDLGFTSPDGFSLVWSTPMATYDPGTLNIDGSGEVSLNQPFNAYLDAARGYTQQMQIFYGGSGAAVAA